MTPLGVWRATLTWESAFQSVANQTTCGRVTAFGVIHQKPYNRVDDLALGHAKWKAYHLRKSSRDLKIKVSVRNSGDIPEASGIMGARPRT